MTGRTHTPSRGAQNVPPGTQLNNMFEVDQLLTAGGMGEVYRGHNIQTNDPVAIKIVLPEFAQDEMILQLFRKEARVLNHLHHEAIVRYYVFSIDAASGLPFLAMEFVDGPSLAERIKGGALDTPSVVTLQKRLADGLQKAHEGGVIHRDIAPDNIILPESRVDLAKIIDFGIARSAAVGGGTLLGGAFAGKYGYVSPEQLGLFGGEVTHRSDIYSLGLVLAACARGRPLDMSGSQVEVIEKRRAVPDLSGIDAPLLELLEAMLQPDPDDRPQSMAEVAAWPTLEPEPKTEIWRPTTRHPHRPGTRHPPSPPAAQPASPPTAAPPWSPEPSAPPAAAQPSTPPPTAHPAPPPASGEPTSPPAAAPSVPPRQPTSPPTGYRTQPTSPPTGYPTQPSSPPTGYPKHSTSPPTGYPTHPPATGRATSPPAMPDENSFRRETSMPPAAPTPPPPQSRPARRRAEKRSRPGLVAAVLFLLVGLVGAIGGWLYVEYSSDDWYRMADPAAEDAQQAGGVTEPPAREAEAPTQEPPPAGEAVAPAEEVPAYTAADITQFVTDFDGGSCFFARTAEVGDGHAEIIGFGNRRDPFDRLRSSFRQRFKFEPVIEYRDVLDGQCVVLEALDTLTVAGAARPQLQLANDIIRSGNTLSGTISGIEGRHLAVLMVDNSGNVYDLADFTESTGNSASFKIPLYLDEPMDVAPQLVVTIASPEPLTSLDLDAPRPATELAPRLLDEAAGLPPGLGTAIGYFKFGS